MGQNLGRRNKENEIVRSRPRAALSTTTDLPGRVAIVSNDSEHGIWYVAKLYFNFTKPSVVRFLKET